MLTKKDITQLLQAFTKVFATKSDLTRFATKKEMKKQHTEVVQKLDRIQDDLNSLTESTGNILSWTDDIHKEIVREKLPQRVRRI